MHWSIGRRPLAASDLGSGSHRTEDVTRAAARARADPALGRRRPRRARLADLAKLDAGAEVQLVQVVYNLARREIEWDLLPACQQAGLPVLASSPFGHGHGVLAAIARRHRVTAAQVALAWVPSHAGVHAHPHAATAT
jgi:aryl-alcohol dehydrogenase-like predicted oxidoreductase